MEITNKEVINYLDSPSTREMWIDVFVKHNINYIRIVYDEFYGIVIEKTQTYRFGLKLNGVKYNIFEKEFIKILKEHKEDTLESLIAGICLKVIIANFVNNLKPNGIY